jgi:hypothetical protein
MADNGVVSAGGRLTDWVSLGVLAVFAPRDAVDDAVAAAGMQAAIGREAPAARHGLFRHGACTVRR